MKKEIKLREHPIDINKHKFLSVVWLGVSHKCVYEGWCPITESDFENPIEGGEYRIVYSVSPLHHSTGKKCPKWERVHHSRVSPFRGRLTQPEKRAEIENLGSEKGGEKSLIADINFQQGAHWGRKETLREVFSILESHYLTESSMQGLKELLGVKE
jgi:hypothetical protein